MNFLHVAGHLGADPEVRFTASGQKVTVLRIAARLRRKGEDDTIWWRATIWGEQFDKMISYLKKGSSIIVIGEIEKPHIYNDKAGNPQVSMSMTASNLMFSPFGKSEQKSEGQYRAPAQTQAQAPVNNSMESAFDTANNNSGFSQATGGSDELKDIFPSDEEIPF